MEIGLGRWNKRWRHVDIKRWSIWNHISEVNTWPLLIIAHQHSHYLTNSFLVELKIKGLTRLSAWIQNTGIVTGWLTAYVSPVHVSLVNSIIQFSQANQKVRILFSYFCINQINKKKNQIGKSPKTSEQVKFMLLNFNFLFFYYVILPATPHLFHAWAVNTGGQMHVSPSIWAWQWVTRRHKDGCTKCAFQASPKEWFSEWGGQDGGENFQDILGCTFIGMLHTIMCEGGVVLGQNETIRTLRNKKINKRKKRTA